MLVVLWFEVRIYETQESITWNMNPFDSPQPEEESGTCMAPQ